MALIDAFKKLHNLGMDVGVSLIVQGSLESVWAVMLGECVHRGYWIIQSDQAARQFSYLVPMEMKLFKGGQKITGCVASAGQQHCAVTLTADAYEGENNPAQLELTSKGRQRELIEWMVAKIQNKFPIVCRSSTPGGPQNTPGSSPAPTAKNTSQSNQNSEQGFDFLK